jgi:D-beta-D-heptose 7-phosphate kinase/D-beta-D-heptose 1-phosphate adenosyltransferase
LVVGDVMLDEFLWGDVQRISPEAPVPVVEVRRRTYCPGGAANAAANVVSLGGRALLAGVIGQDAQAVHLRAALERSSLAADGLIVDADRPTTTKTRIIGHNQQMLRVDSQQCHALATAMEEKLLDWAESQLPRIEACLISDYGKGVVSARLAKRLIQRARRAGKPVVVDPKGVNYAKYRGATVIKPNLHEVEHLLKRAAHDEASLLQAGSKVLSIVNGSALLMTRGAHGMTLFQRARAAVHIPSVARDVFDVTGAGDTVVGVLALALAAGATLEDAAQLANRAAGIVVGKIGTATVTGAELKSAVSSL